MISIFQRIWCVVRGHNWIFRVDRERRCVYLECLRCQKISPGWALNPSIPEPIDFN